MCFPRDEIRVLVRELCMSCFPEIYFCSLSMEQTCHAVTVSVSEGWKISTVKKDPASSKFKKVGTKH